MNLDHWGFLIINIVSWAPNPYSNLLRPLHEGLGFRGGVVRVRIQRCRRLNSGCSGLLQGLGRFSSCLRGVGALELVVSLPAVRTPAQEACEDVGSDLFM